MNFRPKLSLLRNEDVERIISGAYELLTTTGVKIKHEEGLRILSDCGASVDFSTQVAVMPLGLVENDSETFDAQAATESGFGMLLGALAGINMIRGVGMLDHGGAVSMEKMIYDNEVCGMIQRLISGSKEIFVRAKEKKDQILDSYKAPEIDAHTLAEMRRILIEYAEKKGEQIPDFIFND
jgi:trimethylamine:corrinoid methyltransferase-like protein